MNYLVAFVLFLLCTAFSRAEEPVAVEFLPGLKEAALVKLLVRSPPRDLFTVAMEYKPAAKVFVAPSEDLLKKIWKIEGVRKDLFVVRGDLAIPVSQELIKEQGGQSHYPGVTKRGTKRSVAVYRIDSVKQQAVDEFVVGWSNGSGPLSGNGGTILFRRVGNEWIFVEYLKSWVS